MSAQMSEMWTVEVEVLTLFEFLNAAGGGPLMGSDECCASVRTLLPSVDPKRKEFHPRLQRTCGPPRWPASGLPVRLTMGVHRLALQVRPVSWSERMPTWSVAWAATRVQPPRMVRTLGRIEVGSYVGPRGRRPGRRWRGGSARSPRGVRCSAEADATGLYSARAGPARGPPPRAGRVLRATPRNVRGRHRTGQDG